MEKKVSKYPNPDDADDEVSLPKYLTLQTGHQILKEWNLQKNQSFVDLSWSKRDCWGDKHKQREI